MFYQLLNRSNYVGKNKLLALKVARDGWDM